MLEFLCSLYAMTLNWCQGDFITINLNAFQKNVFGKIVLALICYNAMAFIKAISSTKQWFTTAKGHHGFMAYCFYYNKLVHKMWILMRSQVYVYRVIYNGCSTNQNRGLELSVL